MSKDENKSKINKANNAKIYCVSQTRFFVHVIRWSNCGVCLPELKKGINLLLVECYDTDKGHFFVQLIYILLNF